jgi:peptidoglycan hydrolase-like protein with peptidoglycan-binding domain
LILSRANTAILLSAALLSSPALATTTHRATSSAHSSKLPTSHTASSHARTGKKTIAPKSKRPHGQQAIAPERVTQIQIALIRERYLSKEADGRWDTATEAAMQKYQADHGWQTKLAPDSRAIKALGLGPDYSHAINAKDASFSPPPPVSTIPPNVAAGFAEGSGVVR